MPHGPRINLFRDYAKRRWEAFVGKILLDIGIPCPNRTQGGCIYCSTESYKPYYLQPGDDLEKQIEKGKGYIRSLDARLFLGSFQMETATAGDFSFLLDQFSQPLADPDCVGIIISTRPDWINQDQLERLQHRLAAFPEKMALIELGLQSSHPETLELLRRNHSLQDFEHTVKIIRQFPRFELGAHLILGLPGETEDHMRKSLRYVADQGVQHLKLHHLQVIRNTPLQAMYHAKPFPLSTAEEYLEMLCRLLPDVPGHIVLHRLWSTSRQDVLEAPRWNLLPEKLYALLFQKLEQKNLWQGKNCSP